ncbi:unnamed protein product [Effrenium voratum]|uniref:Uncharacterized protein n=1 Tax=Effrenium voratum TaxID=2562239 RepID=A0AA36JJE3_9DINO|nr:unnamed protein product [Effrenium voratum]
MARLRAEEAQSRDDRDALATLKLRHPTSAVPAPFQPSKQFGATEPLGFFDPRGFTAVGDERGFRKLRVSEIKHGRVAMMASIGLVGQHFLKFPGLNSPGWLLRDGQGEGVLESLAGWEAGQLPQRPFGVNMYNDEMRMKELNNGRMAMISVLGIFAAEMATGKDAMQQFGLPALGAGLASSASASRSSFAGSSSSRVAAQQNILRRAEAVVEDVLPPFQPSKQFGATEPLGFFDPLGFTAVGDERGFRKLRVSEIKHGRVAMMASIGLVGQHFLKFPGFEQSPAGFSVMGRGEGVLGFFGIFLLCALLELAWREEPGSDREPGNYGDPFGVNMYNDEMRMKELNNGRMAMISVLGIFAAEMATGKDAIQHVMAPASSRFLGTGVALGLAGAFVAPSRPQAEPQSRAPVTRTPSAAPTGTTGTLATLAAASVTLAAFGKTQLKSTAAKDIDVPAPFQPSKQFGATEPLGFFDPLGFTAVGDERGFRKLRVSEIKHGRVAMMASIGLVGQHFLKFPASNSFFGIFLLCALLELAWREEPGSDREPGNYGCHAAIRSSCTGCGAASSASASKHALQEAALREWQLSRTSCAERKPVVEDDTGSAALNQFGATEPLGFFDPLGFTAVGDERGLPAGASLEEIQTWESGDDGVYRGEGVLGFFGIFLLCALLELAAGRSLAATRSRATMATLSA